MNKPTEKQIEEVLAGMATAEEARMVAQWFATDEGEQYLAQALDQDLQQIKLGSEELYVNHEILTEKMWADILMRIRRKRLRRVLFRVAAVLLPFLFLVALYLKVDSRIDIFGTSDYEEVMVAKGERIQILFQDGTRVYVNSDSYLRYPKTFGFFSREVYLEGEAYFVVAPNKRWPFVVNLNGPSIQVLGTSFDVHAYPENSNITVLLDEGRVNLTLPSQQVYSMEAGQKLVYDKKNEFCAITPSSDSRLFSLWKHDVIAFKDASLDEVVSVLNRWYNVSFQVGDEAARKIRFTLISENTFLEKTLLDLEKISPLRFEYKESEKRVLVTMKQPK